MDKLDILIQSALDSLLEQLLVCCATVLIFSLAAHIPSGSLTTSQTIVNNIQSVVRSLLKAVLWVEGKFAQEPARSPSMTQPQSRPANSTGPSAVTTQHPEQQQDTQEVSASQKPLACSTDYLAAIVDAGPLTSSKPRNSTSFESASTVPNTTAKPGGGDKMAETQPAAAAATAPPKEAEPAKTEKPAEEAKLSNAELKKKAKAEKAARRAKAKQDRGQEAGEVGNDQHQQKQQQAGGQKKGGGGGGGKQEKQQGAQKQQAGAGGGAMADGAESKKKKEQRVNENTPAMFAHLAWQTHRGGVATAGKDVHPAILSLGIQIRDYVICGSSARCVATLLAFKQLIVSYTTPSGTSLARHLTSHLSHQINFLTTCRPLSVSQGNAIRGLKLVISKIGPRVPETDAKSELCEWIDNFITEKITVADQVIANRAAEKVKDGDVILCYAGSNIVRKALLAAHRQGKKFRVSIIGARPLFEGKHFARSLVEAGMQVEYSLINGITPATRGATKVFLGAHAMTSNGCLYSRVGTSLVAMSAKDRSSGMNIPVIVCCETVKFTDRVALDSIVVNEIADPDELVTVEKPWQVNNSATKAEDSNDTKSKKPKPEPTAPATTKPDHPLQNWKDINNLQLLNIMYDVTPREYIDMVITEMGSLPPSAVPTVHRMSTEHEES